MWLTSYPCLYWGMRTVELKRVTSYHETWSLSRVILFVFRVHVHFFRSRTYTATTPPCFLCALFALTCSTCYHTHTHRHADAHTQTHTHTRSHTLPHTNSRSLTHTHTHNRGNASPRLCECIHGPYAGAVSAARYVLSYRSYIRYKRRRSLIVKDVLG
jgi:hypothetical protein